MGGILSLDNPKRKEGERCKTRKISSGTFEEDTRLIPCLPDGIALQILARIPRIHYLNIKRVSRSWKNGITGSELYRLRKELAASEEWLYILTKVDGDKLLWYCFDPLSTKWQRLPLMPMVSHGDKGRKKGLGSTIRMLNAIGSSIWIAHVIRGWLGRKDTMDRMPYTGCSVGALDGSLYVLGGFAQALALTSVWRYDQTLNKWSEVSPMSAGRAHCKAVALDGRLYVVGGVGGGLNPLQSAEAYDPYTGSWIQLPSIPFSKAKVLAAAFLADLKPFASGLISYRGRLFIAQSLYSWPLFVYVGGEVYDPQAGSWDEMPLGMGEGWPARKGGTKLSVAVEGELYSLYPSNSSESAKIKVYDHQDGAWKVIAEDVLVPDFMESEHSYLVSGLLGKLHVITMDDRSNIVVMKADVQHNICPFQSTNSCPFSQSSPVSAAGSGSGSETGLWKVIARKVAFSTDLVSCQTLNI